MVGPVEAVGMGLGLTYRGEKNMVSAKLDVRFPDHQSLPTPAIPYLAPHFMVTVNNMNNGCVFSST